MRHIDSMTALNKLKASLSTVNAGFLTNQFGEPKAMGRTAEDLERKFGEGRKPDTEIVLKTLRNFIQNGVLSGYRDIKYACYGLLVPIQGNITLASNPGSMEALLGIVDAFHSNPKKMKRCFQALMTAYFSLDGCDEKSDHHLQWLALKRRLATWLPSLKSMPSRPEWLEYAFEHSKLFSDNPTDQYGATILRGEHDYFESACEKMGIDRNSWVRRRVVISAIDAATSKGDIAFKSHLEHLIELLRINSGVREEGVVMLLNRYVKQETAPEHILLREIAIETFGNPLIIANQARWFEVTPDARDMVSNWLKGFLIERFFELLSHDGHTDKRRPKFWIRHRKSIENMWFILGAFALSSWNKDFKNLRTTMGNQCLSLDGGATATNNAFIMKIGNIYVVEFGENGNATFLFNKDSLPFDLGGKSVRQTRLKSDNRVERLLHMDGRDTWEDKFSNVLAQYGIYPDDKSFLGRSNHQAGAPSQTFGYGGVFTPPNFKLDLKRFCNERGLQYDDSASTGRIIVYADSKDSKISGKLGQWGFTFDKTHPRWVKKP